LNKIQIHPSFDRSKRDLPGLEKFQINYEIEGFEEMNNFLYTNFFKIKVDLKFKPENQHLSQYPLTAAPDLPSPRGT
jgi:hypothetical protein